MECFIVYLKRQLQPEIDFYNHRLHGDFYCNRSNSVDAPKGICISLCPWAQIYVFFFFKSYVSTRETILNRGKGIGK